MTRILAIIALLAVITSCGSSDGPRSANVEQTDILRIGAMGMPPTQGNPYGAVGPPSSTVWGALFDALTSLDENGELVGALATHWEALDSTTWEFQLRPNVRFANGTPFNANSVVRQIQWLVSDEGRATLVGNELRNIEGAVAIDELTVRVTTKEPDAILPRRVGTLLMVEPDHWDTLGPNGFGSQPIGTGPYRIENWNNSGNTLTATRNPYSWRPAQIEEIHFIALPDQAVRMQALLSGDVDLAIIGVEGVEQLEERGYQIIRSPAMSVTSIAIFSTRKDGAPTTDVKVRQALNYAVDQRAIAKNILGRPERAAGQPAASITLGHDPKLEPYPYDPAKARALLAEAGYPDGFDFRMDVVVNAAPGDADMYQAVAQYLNAVGIRTQLRTQLFSSWLKAYNSGDWEADAFSLAWNAAPYNDVQRPMEYFSCARPNPFFCDREISGRLAEAAAEFDEARREALLKELSRLYREAAPAIFLVEQIMTWGAHPRVGNLKIVNRIYQYEKITLRDPT